VWYRYIDVDVAVDWTDANADVRNLQIFIPTANQVFGACM